MAKAVTGSARKRSSSDEPPERLSEDRLVEAALALAARIGLDRLTMRELAKELGVTQMAAYYYVKNKEELLRLVIDSALRPARLPSPEVGPWDERIRLYCLAIYDRVADAPGVADVFVDVGLTAEGNRLMNDTLDLLLEAGFSERNALLANSILHTFTFGHFSIEARLHTRRDVTLLRSHPTLDRVAPAAKGLHGRDYFQEGLDVVLTGMKAMLEKQRYARPTPRRAATSRSAG